jgi:hypothetical protein
MPNRVRYPQLYLRRSPYFTNGHTCSPEGYGMGPQIKFETACVTHNVIE